MKVEVVEALSDNLMYLVVDETSRKAVVVDPVEPSKILKKAGDISCVVVSVLTTHHHWDHAGGNQKLLEKVPGLSIYGFDDRVAGLTEKVHHEQVITIGNLKITCLHTPCHTSGHICYYITDMSCPGGAVFTGDTLFIGGCGKFFEGTPHQMFTSLYEILAELPGDTEVYCGHEYTVKNMEFAITVEPENEFVSKKLKWAQEKRKQNQVTVPSTIAQEKLYNPFMRVHEPSVQKHFGDSNLTNVMGRLREMKNYFTK